MQTAARARCRDRRGVLPALRLRAGRLLPDRAERVLVQPGPLRRGALRAAGRRRRRALARGGHVADPRGRLRRRGQAADHDRHLRAVLGLLRRVLRPGAEGAHADRPGLRRRVRDRPTCWCRRPRRSSRSASASASTTRWPCTSTTSARCPRRWPARRRSRCRAGCPTACRSACRSWRRRMADDRCYRVAAAFEAATAASARPILAAAPELAR